MIRVARWRGTISTGIPRESGDDPVGEGLADMHDLYSPRERG